MALFYGTCLSKLILNVTISKSCKNINTISNLSIKIRAGVCLINARLLHIGSTSNKQDPGPKKWQIYNQFVWPPQAAGEKRRNAEVYHFKRQIKYSPRKLWYLATMIRSMSIDEAIKQLSFSSKKGSVAIKNTLLEAQKLAVEKHNVEYKSNLWIEDSRVCKGRTIFGARRHARGRYYTISYRYSHYLVRLKEGRPPPPQEVVTSQKLLEQYIEKCRGRHLRYFL